jgi:RHS repeat-associated protein
MPPNSAQYVWSLRYIDSPVLRDYDADGNAGTGGLGAAASGLEQRVYYLTDGNFNVTALADPNGAVLERYAYDAYGQPRVYGSSYGNAILFCGYFRDAETGMYHVRHRYYHPLLGRWMSRDPLGYVDGMNAYEYCRSIPALLNDPSGLDIWIEGPSKNEPWGHKGICVGNPNGNYISYSFGLTSRWKMLIPSPWRMGVVYLDDIGGEVLGGNRSRIATSESQDLWAQSILNDLVGTEMPYSIIYPNCRTFSENMYDLLKEHLPTDHSPAQPTPTTDKSCDDDPPWDDVEWSTGKFF